MTKKHLECRRSDGSNNMLERSGWWQRYRLPRSVRVGAAVVSGDSIVKGASVVRCAASLCALVKSHQPTHSAQINAWE